MEPTVPIRKTDGSEAGAYQLNPAWIELDKGTQAVHDDVVAFLAKNRRGTASTKTRAEARGGGAKPWRQKGLGRARAGSIRSPIWRGGGVTFGPKPRSFAKKINRKVRQLALKRAFSERLNEGAVVVVDELAVAAPKTKNMVAVLDTLGVGRDVLLVVGDVANDVLLASRNLPGVEVMKAGAVNTYWMLLFKKVVFTRDGLDVFGKRLGGVEEQA